MRIKLLIVLSLLIFPLFAPAQEILLDKQETIKAVVTEIVESKEEKIGESNISTKIQTIKALLLEGENKDKVVTTQADFFDLKEGDKIYILQSTDLAEGMVRYTVMDRYRLTSLYVLIGIFIITVLLFGGIQGVRGLVSLVGSILLIVFVLIPGILNGYSPILITIAVSSLIIVIGSYITHGFNKTTTSAVIGMIATVLITGIFAYVAVHMTALTGFETEEATYLNWNTEGQIDLVGLLFGGIMIGLLGVLYDVAIGQAVSVEELQEAGPHLDKKTIFKRALRIGREHTGALVNTLAIAYVGASLPLLLLFFGYSSEGSIGEIINREVFAAEIVRTIVGSIGLVLAVPITTFISTLLLIKKDK